MGHGGARPGSGRPKGKSPNNVVRRRAAADEAARRMEQYLRDQGVEPFLGDSRDFLVMVMKDKNNSLPIRMDAAKTVIKYEHPALAQVEATLIHSLHEQALEELDSDEPGITEDQVDGEDEE